MVAVTVFLDVFHGASLSGRNCNTMYSKCTYYSALAFALFFAGSIPYSRYLLGAHSLDQIVYGSTIGIWCGFTLHLLIRDHLMNHINNLVELNTPVNKGRIVAVLTVSYITFLVLSFYRYT